MDRRLAPLLLFDYDRETTANDSNDIDDAKFFFYSIPRKQLLSARVEEMRDHRFWITPQGWMLMAAPGSPDTFLWDPFTRGRIDLPPGSEGFLNSDGHNNKRCLLSSPTPVAGDPSCLVLVLDLTDTVFWYCRLGGDEPWLRHEYDPSTLGATSRNAFLRSMSTLTSVDGKFFLSPCDKVVTLQFSPEPAFSVFPVNEDMSISPPDYTCFTAQLVESGADLFRVRFRFSDIRSRFIAGISVFKLNLSDKTWVKAESLNGRVFVVHPYLHGASVDPQETGLKGDCIYYCRPQDKALRVYDMERGTTTLHNPAGYFANKVLMPTRTR
ncbi:hypothetical protein QOZ80_6AG0533740 [Eleusine coracana subsp. coracana]|nr:hypothetical protein QOZ80_6AG0533740 [Eleusine coracana subsp. coracana]